MSILSRRLPFVALLYLMIDLPSLEALPVGEATLDSAPEIPKNTRMDQGEGKLMHRELPGSPADLLRPDIFQFYTFDKSGEVIKKEMTKHEIQSLIAAGGGHLPPMAPEIHEPQKAGDVPTGGTRVADVVQNVQNVLKGELSKPTPMISTIPKIPGHANSEWSSILPSILTGDMESIALSPPEVPRPQHPDDEKIPVYVGHPMYEEITERPMIQVPVITVEEKLPIQNNSSSDEESNNDQINDNGPIFQILNTISADMLRNTSNSVVLSDQITDASESFDRSTAKPQIQQLKNDSTTYQVPTTTQNSIENITAEGINHVISIVSETHSTSIKIPGYDEMKIDQSKLQSITSSSETSDSKEAVNQDKPVPSTSKPIIADDKFEIVQPIEPVLLNNILKEFEIQGTTAFEPLETTEIIPTSEKNEDITTEAIPLTTEYDKSEDPTIPPQDQVPVNVPQAGSTTESIPAENTTDQITQVTQHDSTTPDYKIESISITTPSVLITGTDAPPETTTSTPGEIKLEDPVTEIIPRTTPEDATEKTSEVAVEVTTQVPSTTPESTTTIEREETPLSVELEDSLSSMISQISEAIIEPSLPARNDQSKIADDFTITEDMNKQEFSSTDGVLLPSSPRPLAAPEITPSTPASVSPAWKTNATVEDNSLKESKLKPSVSTEATETPIVRIDIMTPAETTATPEMPPVVPEEESPVVRIQLTDPVTAVNHIIESIPADSHSAAPEIQPMTFPTRGSISPNNISSSLIAGFSNNEKANENTTEITDPIPLETDKKESFAEKAEESIPEVALAQEQPTTDYDKNLATIMQQINFNELPIVQSPKKPSVTHKTEPKIDSATPEPEIPAIKFNNSAPIIQLDDLPIVHHKVNRPKPLMKVNITNNHEKEEPVSLKPQLLSSLHIYADDPYKKLGETVEPQISTTETSQINLNKTLKIKDQKKDSSMELMEKLPLIPLNQNQSQSEKKPLKTATTPVSIKGQDKPKESDRWTLIPQQLPPTAPKKEIQAKRPTLESITAPPESTTHKQIDQIALTHSKTVEALDSSVKSLKPDISYFSNLCNKLAFSFWISTNEGLSPARSLAVSPFGMTSMLAMVFLGARGPTSEKMNNLLKLDDVASFNPHLIFQNITDSVGLARKQGIANAAFVRELFADREKVRKLFPFYKKQAQQFYDGVVAEVNFGAISELVRKRTNLMVRKQTGGRIKDFVRSNTIPLTSPLAALSANVFQTDCNSKDASSDGRDGELYFAVSPAIRQRKLVPVPSTVWRAGVLAGYEPNLDATAIALGGPEKLVSTIFVIPGQQGFTAPGDSLELLEERLIRGATHDGAWNKLLTVVIPRPGLELQVPKFSHRSVINATGALKRMGLREMFDKHADLKGINGVGANLHLTDVVQMNLFSTCGDENIQNGRHHVEVYPSGLQRNARGFKEFPRDYKPRTSEPLPSIQREDLDKPRLKLDRPFLYFVRHNPTGLILHMGRFNPRLLP
ncbi:mucin-17 [Fopius arisanus]|uniref:Mucin-17 n=2 Tax=Fopius arisanus TaxID=64838 RepID=A0A9R1T9X4_9HYME|nr:PREDICTED: mucin-17 [Fopius arisanus]